MRAASVVVWAGLLAAAAPGSDWVPLFNGKDLAGWRANTDPGAFTVADGVLRVQATGATSAHLFYVGDLADGVEPFTHFELEVVARSEPNSNGGLFIHCDMITRDKALHLARGYEIQLNSSAKEKRKTGSLYAVVDLDQSPVDETRWFTARVRVQGKRIGVFLNDRQVVDYTEPDNVQRPKERAGRLLNPAGGAIALQAHDRNSVFYFKQVRVRRLPAADSAPTPAPTPEKWEKEVRAFEAADRKAPPAKGGVVFTGASGIRLWASLKDDFPDHAVVNRGFGGSGLSDVTHFADRILVPHAPRLIVLYPGGNDIHQGKSPERVAADFRAFVTAVRAKLPDTRIAFISLAPNPARFADADKLRAANRLIAAAAAEYPRVDFVDLFPLMLGPDGGPRPELFTADRLHMNAAGYQLWAGVLNDYLRGAGR